MTYGKRLNEAMAYAKKTRKQLAERLGCSPQIIGMIINGAGRIERKFSTENHATAVEFLGVNGQWLLYGDGDMLDVKTPAEPIPIAQDAPAVSALCAEIQAMINSLPDDPAIRWQVMGKIGEVVAKARGSPVAHRPPPAYSPTATRTAKQG